MVLMATLLPVLERVRPHRSGHAAENVGKRPTFDATRKCYQH